MITYHEFTQQTGMTYYEWAEACFIENAVKIGLSKETIEAFLKENYERPDIVETNAEILDAALELNRIEKEELEEAELWR